jgi:hypothetical protein
MQMTTHNGRIFCLLWRPKSESEESVGCYPSGGLRGSSPASPQLREAQGFLSLRLCSSNLFLPLLSLLPSPVSYSDNVSGLSHLDDQNVFLIPRARAERPFPGRVSHTGRCWRLESGPIWAHGPLLSTLPRKPLAPALDLQLCAQLSPPQKFQVRKALRSQPITSQVLLVDDARSKLLCRKTPNPRLSTGFQKLP